MKNSLAAESTERLKRVLLQDKLSNPARLSEIVKEEVLFVLSSYMDILPRDVKFFITVDDEGMYNVQVNARAKRIYAIKH